MNYLFWGVIGLFAVLLLGNKIRSGSFFSTDKRSPRSRRIDRPDGAQHADAKPAAAQTIQDAIASGQVSRFQTVQGLGVAALIIGGLSLMIAWVPFLGAIAAPLEILGCILALIGIFGGYRKVTVFKPVAGLLLCLLPMLWQGMFYAGFYHLAQHGVNEIARQMDIPMVHLDKQERAYVEHFIDVYALKTQQDDDDAVDLTFKMSNQGNKVINSITAEVDFLDDDGGVIYSQEIHPITAGLKGQSSLHPDSDWESPSPIHFDDIPDSWAPGMVRITITAINFGQML